MILFSIILAKENAYGQLLRSIERSIERSAERAVERELTQERRNAHGNNFHNNENNQGELGGGGVYPVGGVGIAPVNNGFGGQQVGFGRK